MTEGPLPAILGTMKEYQVEVPWHWSPRTLARFTLKIEFGPIFEDTPCVLWTASTVGGYARFSIDGTTVNLHNYLYKQLIDDEASEDLDHKCKRKNCVNVQHLEEVTHRENVRRGEALAGVNSRKTHCIKGHEFTERNTTIRSNGSRRCKECHRQRQRLRYQMR